MPAERDPEQNTADRTPRDLRTSGVPHLESTRIQAEAMMTATLKLQLGQNGDDERWLQKLGLPRDVEDEIWLRLVNRGGQWVDFVQNLVGFKESLGSLRDKTL